MSEHVSSYVRCRKKQILIIKGNIQSENKWDSSLTSLYAPPPLFCLLVGYEDNFGWNGNSAEELLISDEIGDFFITTDIVDDNGNGDKDAVDVCCFGEDINDNDSEVLFDGRLDVSSGWFICEDW